MWHQIGPLLSTHVMRSDNMRNASKRYGKEYFIFIRLFFMDGKYS